VYAYSQGIGSAREVARRCEYDPAFQWLTGLQEVNYHTLADFRVEKQKELDELFRQVLAALSKEGLITLDQVMQDGTKIRAQASPRSVHWENQIQTHLEGARRRVAEMGDPQSEEASPREKQSRARARRERQERLEKSLEKLRTLKAARSPHKRVSITDPEARIMKQPDGGLALSYNAQLSTDASHGLIVGVRVTQAASDWEQIVAGAGTDRSKAAAAAEADCCGRGLHDARRDRGNGGTPDGFSGQHAPRRCEQRANCPHRLPPSAFLFQSETHRYVCPEGKFLYHEGHLKNERGLVSRCYLARAKDCQACVRKPECCPEIAVAAGEFCGWKRAPRCCRSGRRWPRSQRGPVTAAAEEYPSFVTHGSKAS
jgi:Transposase domain (DUF772)